jgi:hypothetical protein
MAIADDFRTMPDFETKIKPPFESVSVRHKLNIVLMKTNNEGLVNSLGYERIHNELDKVFPGTDRVT